MGVPHAGASSDVLKLSKSSRPCSFAVCPSEPTITTFSTCCHRVCDVLCAGHVGMLADPTFAEIVHSIGLASLGADDKTIKHLTKVCTGAGVTASVWCACRLRLVLGQGFLACGVQHALQATPEQCQFNLPRHDSMPYLKQCVVPCPRTTQQGQLPLPPLPLVWCAGVSCTCIVLLPLHDSSFSPQVFWYTVEFGCVREGDAVKAFGAAILSSYGELEHFAKASTHATHCYSLTGPPILSALLQGAACAATVLFLLSFQPDVVFYSLPY